MFNTIKDPIIEVIEMLENRCLINASPCNECIFSIDGKCPITMLDNFWAQYHEYFIDDYKDE